MSQRMKDLLLIGGMWLLIAVVSFAVILSWK